MKYIHNDVKYSHYPKTFDKNSIREVLQYSLAGMLYMPATRIQIADEIINKTKPWQKTICLDLEDSVGDDTLLSAEESLIEILEKIYNAYKSKKLKIKDIPLIFIRVRTPEHFKTLSNSIPLEYYEILTGFNFPKFEKSNCMEFIESFNELKNKINTPIYFNPILESKSIMNKMTRLNELNYLHKKLTLNIDNILNIRVGATDFCSTYGIRRKITQSIYDVGVVQDCLVDILNIFSKNFVCSGPVWEYFSNDDTETKWKIGLGNELEKDFINGFIGKTSIHPKQLDVISKTYIVTTEDYEDALSILGIKTGTKGVLKSHKNNKMNEIKPHTIWAQKVITLAEIYGVMKEV